MVHKRANNKHDLDSKDLTTRRDLVELEATLYNKVNEALLCVSESLESLSEISRIEGNSTNHETDIASVISGYRASLVSIQEKLIAGKISLTKISDLKKS